MSCQPSSKTTSQSKKKNLEEAYAGAREKPWAEDVVAHEVVATFGAMSCAEVGVVMGLCDERIRQIEKEALIKCRAYLDPEKGDIVEQLRELFSARDEMVYPEPILKEMPEEAIEKRLATLRRNKEGKIQLKNAGESALKMEPRR